jgi:hypothetical protein
MLRAREKRRLVASLFGLILLLCQSIALAQACIEAMPSELAVTDGACHDAASAGAGHSAGHNNCESQTSTFGQASLVLPAIATPPALKVRLDEARVGGSCVQLTTEASAQPPPVPLILVHCRLQI